MAATLTAERELTWASFPIEKVESEPDGSVTVYGKATDASIDSDEQIVDTEFAAKGLAEWMESGPNVRVQHQAQRDPAGVGLTVEKDGDAHWVKSRIIEPVAKQLVLGGALRAYSVGIARPTIVRDHSARGGRITDGQIVEISLVDRPANKNCGIQLVKADEGGKPEWVGKVFGTGVLEKSEDDVTVSLPPDVQVGFSPSDLAKIIARRNDGAEKRKLTSEARNALPDSSFVFPDKRAYPIHDESHARNALSRVAQHGTPEEQARVRAAVHRRYPNIGKKPKKSKGMVAGPGMSSAGAQTGVSKGERKRMRKAADRVAHEALPDVTKPVDKKDKSMCLGCGAKQNSMHAYCSECGKSMHDAPPVEKNHDFQCLTCRRDLDKGERFCPGCGTENPGYNPMADQKIPANKMLLTKGGKPDLEDDTGGEPAMKRKNGKKGKGMTGAKVTPEPPKMDKGKKKKPNPFGDNQAPPFGSKDKDGKDDAAEKTADAPVTAAKGKKGKGFGSTASPAQGVTGMHTESVPAHREPDGLDVEEFERDAGLPSSHDSLKAIGEADPEAGAALRFKALGADRDEGYLHDLTCPAFGWDDVAKAHPGALDRTDANAWQAKALQAASTAPLPEAKAASQLGQHVFTIKSAALSDLIDVKNDLNKAFRDANPGPSAYPTPGCIHAQQFNRPHITAGRASYGAHYDGPNDASVITGSIAASQFHRDYISAGTAEESPANKGGNTTPYPQVTGEPQHLDYSSIHKSNVAQAMIAMHDHLARIMPSGICPMNPVTTAPAHSPDGVGKSGTPDLVKDVSPDGMSKKQRKRMTRKLTRKVMSGKMDLDTARIRMGKKPKNRPVTLAPKAAEPEIVKAAEVPALTSADLEKAMKRLSKQVNKRLDALGDQPDQRYAPFRGMALDHPIRKGALPAGASTIAENAAQTQLMVLRDLEKQARDHPDPMHREAAWRSVLKMKGLDGLAS